MVSKTGTAIETFTPSKTATDTVTLPKTGTLIVAGIVKDTEGQLGLQGQ